MNLSVLRYKEYTFPHNPETCTLECERSVAKHKYPGRAGEELEDFNPDAAVVSGEGVFIGPNAYLEWQKLWTVFRSHGPGRLVHPIFSIDQAVFKKLSAKLEPREDYVAFSFEFWEHVPLVYQAPIQEIKQQAATQPKKVSKYKVKAGDTLWELSAKFLGDGRRWQEIANLNKIKDPRELKVGQELVLP